VPCAGGSVCNDAANDTHIVNVLERMEYPATFIECSPRYMIISKPEVVGPKPDRLLKIGKLGGVSQFKADCACRS
jgi:hypothetical protein